MDEFRVLVMLDRDVTYGRPSRAASRTLLTVSIAASLSGMQLLANTDSTSSVHSLSVQSSPSSTLLDHSWRDRASRSCGARLSTRQRARSLQPALLRRRLASYRITLLYSTFRLVPWCSLFSVAPPISAGRGDKTSRTSALAYRNSHDTDQ